MVGVMVGRRKKHPPPSSGSPEYEGVVACRKVYDTYPEAKKTLKNALVYSADEVSARVS